VLLVAFVSLFILFLWLNFVLTQDLETIGREIQVKNRELRSLERENQALKKEISADGSQVRMAAQAMTLGYRPQTPVFLTLNEPLVQASSDTPAGGGGAAAPLAEGGEWSSQAANSLLAVLAGQVGTSEPVPIP
jgi:hypothetical protein